MDYRSQEAELELTVLVVVVSGKRSVHRCLKAINSQIDFEKSEVIVPFDKWSADVFELKNEFPNVIFHLIEDLGLASSDNVSSLQHRLFDRRRAVGLSLARGEIIAMTEDHATPAKDWCEQILKLHEQSYDVIGGVIENKIDEPLNWAWYYCDFGRYGSPLENGEVGYVSDINIAYKRHAIMSVREKWENAYHETTVNWALLQSGSKLLLDERMVVNQERPRMPLNKAFMERVSWGRVFAETRAENFGYFQRFFFGIGAFVLPPVLLARAVRYARRQKQPLLKVISIFPYLVLLVTGWSLGESIGYIKGAPHS